MARYRGVRGCDGRNVVVGVRAEDLHPAADAAGPARRSTRALELVEALGSASMAYFHIDVDAYRARGARCRRRGRGGDDAGRTRAALVAAQPEPRRALPAARRAAARRRRPGRDRPRQRCTSSTRRRVRRFGSCARRSSARRRSPLRRGGAVSAQASATPTPPSGAALDALAKPPTRTARSPRSASTSSCPTGTRTATRRTTAAA